MKGTGLKFTVDAENLRVHTRVLLGPFSGQIEETGDQIAAGATDPRIRKEALIWKADAIPALRASLFRADPLVAVLDTWVLAEQLIDYLETGPGRARLGEWAEVALVAPREMRTELMELVDLVIPGEGLERGRQFVESWAAANPIVDSIASRRSIIQEATSFKTRAGVGGAELVGSLAVTLDDTLRQVEAYAIYIPKQARWEAQLAVVELLGEENLDRAVKTLPVLLDSAESLGGTLEDLPGLVSAEREAVLAALRRERIESLEFLRRERIETLAQIAAERAAVLSGADAISLTVIEALGQELAAMADLVDSQRSRVMVDAERIAGSELDHAFANAESLVDHICWRLVWILLAVFLGCVLLLLLAWLLFRRQPVAA
jgi:hypothetical protein